MKIKDQEGWDKGVANNKDPYGAAVFTFAQRWAEMMEAEIAKGRTVVECADRTSHAADEEGITGFMYGCAVNILSHAWEHGEELRVWHNLATQLGDEGEKANTAGGVLNPAFLNIER